MSIVALKRRAKLVNNLSGKDPQSIMVIRGPGQTEVLSSGGGFSLNGKQRNIGYVGKNSLQSSGGTKMRPGTTDWKGNGGCCNNYVINPSQNNECCVENVGVKPSTLNTKGMLADKYRWKKTRIPDSTFRAQGFEPPANHQLESIYHRWVSSDSNNYNMQKSAQQYTENLAAAVAFANPPKENSGTGRCFNPGYHIGGKYYPPKPYSKFLHPVGDGNRAIQGAIAKRASVFPRGYNRAFPTVPTPDQCNYHPIQASDPYVLNTYYFDQNNTSIYSCPPNN